MISLFQNVIAYKYNDMSHLFYDYRFFEFIKNNIWSPDGLSSYLVRLFVGQAGLIPGLNLLAGVHISLNLLCSYLLFNKVASNRIFASIFSVLYSFSIYFLFRIISLTPNLYPIFIFPLTFYLLLKKTKPIYLGVFNFFFMYLSSYYVYFNCILIALWYLLDREYSNLVKFFAPIFIGTIFLFLPYLTTNTYFGKYSETSPTTVYRPIEDWYNFSFRPWYFITPPGSSIFFSKLHNNIYSRLQKTGNYLLVNYSEDEMAGSYMGWHFVIGSMLVFFNIFLNKKDTSESNNKLLKKCFLMLLGISLISGPPSITIFGFQIYTPSYLLYYVVPVFRTLSRWASVIYLLVLVINYTLIYAGARTRFLKTAFILSFVLLNYVVFAIRIPFINIRDVPEEVTRFSKLEGKSLVFYPEADYYILFWSQIFNKEIINPKDTLVEGLQTKDFSAKLLTGDNTGLFDKSDTRYLIYNKNSDDSAEKRLNELFGPPENAGNGFYIYSLSQYQ